MRKFRIFLVVLAILSLVGIFFFVMKKDKKSSVPLPPATSYSASLASETNNPKQGNSSAILPDEVNLAVPFTSQAPHQNWDLPYQEFCEEASTLMAASFIRGETISGPDDADKKMLAIKDFEEKKLGFFKDTNAEETAVILKEYFGLSKIEVISDPAEETIKRALAGGKAVIVPLAGRELGNPHYKRPGPLFHMLVVKGYTRAGDFITNDPGTRSGADYVYRPSILLNAIHDWNNGDVYKGKKAAIIVG
jgi:hypothetical protein